jgi:hypothetical protein
LFDEHQIESVHAALIKEQWNHRSLRRYLYTTKNPKYLPDIAGEAFKSKNVGRRPVPLHDVMVGRVPEEGITNRGVWRAIVLG